MRLSAVRRRGCAPRPDSAAGLELKMEMVSAALLLFLIMDPLGNIPVFLSLLKPL
ncbi:MAG: MarC family protein, partial [Arenimonas sp.]